MLKIIMPITRRVTACATPCKISEEVNEGASERGFCRRREDGLLARSISAFSFRNLILSQLRLELSVDKKNTREMLVPAAKKVDLIAQRT